MLYGTVSLSCHIWGLWRLYVITNGIYRHALVILLFLIDIRAWLLLSSVLVIKSLSPISLIYLILWNSVKHALLILLKLMDQIQIFILTLIRIIGVVNNGSIFNFGKILRASHWWLIGCFALSRSHLTAFDLYCLWSLLILLLLLVYSSLCGPLLLSTKSWRRIVYLAYIIIMWRVWSSTLQLELLLTCDWWISRGSFRLFSLVFWNILIYILIRAFWSIRASRNDHWRKILSILVSLLGHVVQILHVSLLAGQTSGHVDQISRWSSDICAILFAIHFSIFATLLIRHRIFIIPHLLPLHLPVVAQVHRRHIGLHLLLSVIIGIDLFQIGLPFITICTVYLILLSRHLLFPTETILLSTLLIAHVLLDHSVVWLTFALWRLLIGLIRVILVVWRHDCLLRMIIWLRFH